MRRKILLDILFYLIVPLVVWNYGRGLLGSYYAILVGTVPALLYAGFDFLRTRELSISGLFLVSEMILNFVFNVISKTAEGELWNGIYVSIISIVFYVITMLIRKPIGMYFFIDYAYAKGIPRKTSARLYSLKGNLIYFQWFTAFLALRELVTVIIRGLMIHRLGLDGFNKIQIGMSIVNYAFTGLTIVLVIRILKRLKHEEVEVGLIQKKDNPA